MKRVVVLGGGESGVGAAVLAQKEGFDVFLSDMSKIKEHYKQMLEEDGVINLKTDSKHLYAYTAAVIERLGLDVEVQNDDIYGSGYADEVLSVKTAYETKFVAMGLPITYTRFGLKNCDNFEFFEWEGDEALEKDAEENRTKAF